jgi:hypothetical protein
MRLFAAALPSEATQRTAVPAEILRRLAFGRPQRRSIQPAAPTDPIAPVPPVAPACAPSLDSCDLDERVRQSGEW